MIAAKRGAIANTLVPYQRAAVRVQRPEIPGLLTGNQQLAPTRGYQHGGTPEIEIHGIGVIEDDTVGASLPAAAAEIPHVVFKRLEYPLLFARFKVKGNDGITGYGSGVRGIFPGSDIDLTALRVYGRSAPYRRAGRTPLSDAGRAHHPVIVRRRHGVILPQLFAAARIKCSNGTVVHTAFEARIAAGGHTGTR